MTQSWFYLKLCELLSVGLGQVLKLLLHPVEHQFDLLIEPSQVLQILILFDPALLFSTVQKREPSYKQWL